MGGAFEDRAPHVHILKPESPLTVVEGYRVPVVVQATDDIGIDRVTLQASRKARLASR